MTYCLTKGNSIYFRRHRVSESDYLCLVAAALAKETSFDIVLAKETSVAVALVMETSVDVALAKETSVDVALAKETIFHF